MKCCDCCGGIKPIVTPVVVLTPLDIMSGNIVAGWDAADLSATPVASWVDASGNGFTLTEATNQPSWNATGGPNSQPSVLFDGVNDMLTNTSLDLPAPGTTPTFYWAIMRQVTSTPAENIFAAGGTSLFLRQTGASPNVAQGNTSFPSNSHGGWTLNTFMRVEVYFSNSTSDYIKAGAAAATTGQNAGNSDPTATFRLATASGGSFSNIEVCEFWIFNTLPTTGQRASLDAYVTSRYGAGLV